MKKALNIIFVFTYIVLIALSFYLFSNWQQSTSQHTRFQEQLKQSVEVTFKDEILIRQHEYDLRTHWENMFSDKGIDENLNEISYKVIPLHHEDAVALLPQHATPIFFGADENTIQITYTLHGITYQLFYYPHHYMRKIITIGSPIEDGLLNIVLINENNEEHTVHIINY